MKIKEIKNQIRRDFTAIYECESCGFEKEGIGYDDEYFHQNVVPSLRCGRCEKQAPTDFIPRKPKYDENAIV